MKTNELIELSLFIITEYYKNNLEPFFEYISDDVLWIGPAQRQLIQGRENLIQTFLAEQHDLTFTMGDIKVLCSSPHRHVCEVLLRYNIYTHFPSGNTDLHKQWLHYTWRDTGRPKGTRLENAHAQDEGSHNNERRPEIVLLHISNEWPYDERDTIYPVHLENVPWSIQTPAELEQYVTVRAIDQCVYRIAASQIMYIETVKRSAKLQIHTENGIITVNDTLSKFEEKHPGILLRVHSGYLLNPRYVKSVRRFQVILSDGTTLPIPEKKYTWFKKQIGMK